MENLNSELTKKVIGLALQVHRELGPGLLESAYKECLAYELSKSDIQFQLEVRCPVVYKEMKIDCGYRIDILIEDKLILELKSVAGLQPIHEAQLLTYLRLSNKKIGLLINFNEKLLKNGIKRLVL